MKTLLLAQKIVAIAVCLALPFPAQARNLANGGRFGVQPVVTKAAPGFHQELNLKIDSLIPAGAPLGTAITAGGLYSLIDAAPGKEAASAARAQADVFLRRIMLLPREQAARELEAALVPAEQASRILEAAEGVSARRSSDRELSKAYKAIETGETPSVSVIRKAKRLAAALENAFAPQQLPEIAGGVRMMEGGYGPGFGWSEGSERSGAVRSADAPTLVRAGFVPVAKKVTELRKLEATDPDAAFALAEKYLTDPAEPRVEVRSVALRLIASFPAERSTPVLLKSAAETANWYIQRLAIKLSLAGAAAGVEKEKAIEIYKGAFKSSNDSVRLMAKDALQKLGVDAGKEPAPKLAETVRGRVPSPQQRLAPQNPNGQQPGPKGTSIFKIMMWGLALFMLVKIFTAPAPQTPQQPVNPPAAIEQTIEAPTLPEAKTPEQAAMNQVAREMHEMKEIQARQLQMQEEDRAERKKKEAAANTPGAKMLSFFLSAFMIIAPIFLLVWLFRRMQGGQANQVAKNLSGGKMNLEKPDTKFSDVAGADDALRQVQQVVDYIRRPERYTRLGAKAPKGILLEGPPGTGKTLMARALAGESDANFISMKGSDFIELFVGVGAGRVRDLFETARRAAPTIIFIDEIDAIGRARGRENLSGGSSEHDQTLISLIAELDGFSKMDNVIVVAATNRADVLDPALLRPGRFDRKIYVGKPDVLGREAILAVHGSKYRLGPDVDLEFTARRTSGLAGAGMANLLNEAATQGAVEDRDAIVAEDVQRGVDKETMGERRHLYIDDATKQRVAYHEAGHALADMLSAPNRKAPNKITIIPHGSAALGYAEQAEEGETDTYLLTMDQLEARIIGAMGGRAAEEVIYGATNKKKGISTGPGSDIEDHADRIARTMVEKLGMSEKVGIIDAGRDRNSPIGGYKVSEATRELVDEEVRRITGESLSTARRLLEENRDKLEAMVKILMERETIYQSEIEEIVRGPKAN